jgi:two-component system phosphate regulon sensor histidine kinase PhoR
VQDHIPRGRDSIDELASRIESLHSRAERLDLERSRLLAVLSGMGEGVIAVDTQERVVQMNDAAARILDMPVAELQGHRLWERLRVSALVDTVRHVLTERSGRLIYFFYTRIDAFTANLIRQNINKLSAPEIG